MKNESYERLFNYAIHLHGKAPSIPIINLLIHRFSKQVIIMSSTALAMFVVSVPNSGAIAQDNISN